VARHELLARRRERRRERRDEGGDQHRVGVRPADDEAVDRVGARAAEGHRHAGRDDDALRLERILLRDQAHRDLAVGAHARAEVALDELALQVQCLDVDGLDPRRRHRRPVQAGEDHHRDEQRHDGDDDPRPAPLGGDRGRMRVGCARRVAAVLIGRRRAAGR
jgi:hypothetical protein